MKMDSNVGTRIAGFFCVNSRFPLIVILVATTLLLETSTGLAANVLTKDFLADVKAGFPQILCEEGKDIQSCVTMSANQCTKAMGPVVKECVDDLLALNLPKFVPTKKDAGAYSEEIFDCAIDRFFKKYRRHVKPICQD